MTATSTERERISRSFTIDRREVRSSKDGTIEIKVVPWRKLSHDLGGFVERFMPGSVKPGTVVNLNMAHDRAKIIASTSNGTLSIEDRADGWYFRVRPSESTIGRDALTMVREGLISRASIEFLVEEDRWISDGATRIREVVSAVGVGAGLLPEGESAYEDTSALARSVEVARQRSVDPYEVDPRQCWLLDLADVASHEEERSAILSDPSSTPSQHRLAEAGLLGGGSSSSSDWIRGSLDEKRNRLAALRTVTSTATTGGAGAFTFANGPTAVVEEFASAAHDVAVLTGLLAPVTRPLTPDLGGPTFTIPAFSVGASSGVQTAQLATFNTSDPVATPVTGIIATIATTLDISVQAAELSRNVDAAIAAELGAALGEKLEAQLLGGSATSGETRGLLNVSGAASVTYTASTPNLLGTVHALEKLAGDVATARKRPSRDLAVLVHPRRASWLRAQQVQGAWLPGFALVEVPAIPTNLSSSQDAAIALYLDDVRLYTSPIRIEAFREAGIGTGMIRVRAYTFAAFFPHRTLGTSVGVAGGSGFGSPIYEDVS